MVRLKTACFFLDHMIFVHQCPEAAYQPHFHLQQFLSPDQIATPRDHFLNFNQKTFNFLFEIVFDKKRLLLLDRRIRKFDQIIHQRYLLSLI